MAARGRQNDCSLTIRISLSYYQPFQSFVAFHLPPFDSVRFRISKCGFIGFLKDFFGNRKAHIGYKSAHA